MIEQMLAHNREFLKSEGYRRFASRKYPDKKIAILTCMDTRLVELLPAALGIRNGDVKMIKNAGGMITGPFDSAVRSLLVGIVELEVEEVMVIGHTDCGVSGINAEMMIHHLIERGVSQDHIDMMRYCGIDFEAWLRGFDTVENSVAETVELLQHHPLMPRDVTIRGICHQHRNRGAAAAGAVRLRLSFQELARALAGGSPAGRAFCFGWRKGSLRFRRGT